MTGLAQLRSACEESPALKPLWNDMAVSACRLMRAMCGKIDDRVELDGKVRPKTTENISRAQGEYAGKCLALLAELDTRQIPHPQELNVFRVFELYI